MNKLASLADVNTNAKKKNFFISVDLKQVRKAKLGILNNG